MCEVPLPGQTKDYIDKYSATHVPLRTLSNRMVPWLFCCVETTVDQGIAEQTQQIDAATVPLEPFERTCCGVVNECPETRRRACGAVSLQCVAGSCHTLYTAFSTTGIDQLLQLNKCLNTPFRWSTLGTN